MAAGISLAAMNSQHAMGYAKIAGTLVRRLLHGMRIVLHENVPPAPKESVPPIVTFGWNGG